MSELTVDFWVAVSVIPMVMALGIYLWLSKRFDHSRQQEVRRYEELVQKAQEPLEGMPRKAAGRKARPPSEGR
ncbi:MAG: hypothetical protein JSS56_00375 [Proteobacteria bacterium]|nr:hypothetical protein [Pseudomonadota bacterium]